MKPQKLGCSICQGCRRCKAQDSQGSLHLMNGRAASRTLGCINSCQCCKSWTSWVAAASRKLGCSIREGAVSAAELGPLGLLLPHGSWVSAQLLGF